MVDVIPLLFPVKNPDYGQLTFPYHAYPDINGIRCLIVNGVPVLRNGKPLPNENMSKTLLKELKDNDLLRFNLDGMLVVGNPYDKEMKIRSQAGVFKNWTDPIQFTYWVFDSHSNTSKFTARYSSLTTKFKNIISNVIKLVPMVSIKDQRQLNTCSTFCFDYGFDGLMIRQPDSAYKNGRATEKDNIGYKIRKNNETEGNIVKVLPLTVNKNDIILKYFEELHGKVKVAKDAKEVELPCVGSFECVDTHKNTFNVHVGVDFAVGIALWKEREKLLNKFVSIRYSELSYKKVPQNAEYNPFKKELKL